MTFYIRFMWILSTIRLEWLGGHFTSFDMLQYTVSVTRALQQSGDRAMVADWLKHSLLPSLRDVQEWAEEQINEAGNEHA